MASIAHIPRARQTSPAEELVQTIMFRLIRCEAALREAIEFAEQVREADVTFADKEIINDHIAYLASVETPEECRP